MDSAFDIEVLEVRAASAAGLLKAFANRSRLRLICSLYRGEKSVSELADSFSFTQSNLSQHLACLRRHKLVSVRRDGASKIYTLVERPAHDVLRTLELICGTR